MRSFVLFALFTISISSVAQIDNDNEYCEKAHELYDQGDYKGAFQFFLKAANAGNANAQNFLGGMYEYGDGVTQNYSKAFEWYSKAAKQNHYYAQYELGLLYFEGNGVKQNYDKALEWLTKSAKNNYSLANYQLGLMYYKGDGVKKDYLKAYDYFIKSAENQDEQFHENYYLLGNLFLFGYGVKKDYLKAYDYFSKAAELNDCNSQYYIGYLYEMGFGVNQDYMKAFEWYTKAANQGDLDAINNLGGLYYYGKGVKQDYIKAYEYFSKAANDNDDENAMNNLGYMCLEGLGVNKDYDKAEKWLNKSLRIRKDNPFAYSNLALLYAKRDNNYIKAKEYSDKALECDEFKEFNSIQKAKLYGKRGEIFYLQGLFSEAQNLLKECLDLNHNYLLENECFATMMANYNKKNEFRTDDNSLLDIPTKYSNDNNVDNVIHTEKVNNRNTFAVIIGNETYKNESDVPYAFNDAHVFSEYIEKTIGVPRSQIRLIVNASYNDLRIAINWLSQAMTVCRGKGKAIIYYAGHGIPNESDQSAYLLPADGIGNDPGSAYALQELYDKLGNVDAQSITIFLDACFSGSKREEGMLTSARGVAIKAKQSTPRGNLIVFSAAQGNETAYPFKEKQHGMFTYFLLKKLQETKGEVTLGELSEYLADEVGRQSFIKNNKIQTPTVSVAPSLQNSWKSIKLK